MTDPLLDVSDLRVRFETGAETVRAVDGISLSVDTGEIVGLVGESGCGKSAAVRAIAGLHGDDARVEGTVSFDGAELRALADERRRRIRATRLSTVFQDPSATLTPTRTVGFHLEEALRLAARPDDRSVRSALGLSLDPRDWDWHEGASERRKRAAELLERVGLGDPGYLERYPHELSGGEAQRVSIAIALAPEPDLLLADEPTTALDATTRAAVLDLLESLVDERDLAALLVSHDLGLVGERCDRVAVAYAGELMESGPADRVLTAPRHPYTRSLLACRLENAAPGERLPTIDGSVPDPTAERTGCSFASRCPHATETCRTTAPPTVDDGDGRVRCGELEAVDTREPDAALGEPNPSPARTRNGSDSRGETDATCEPETDANAITSADGGESAGDDDPLLELRRVSKRYPIDDSWLARLRGRDRYATAVADVSLAVRRGETLGIVGESGAGKSTVIDLVTGLESPTSGEVVLEGAPVGAVADRSRDRLAAVGRLFQHPRSSLDPRQRVRTAVAEPLLEAGWNRDRRRERVSDLLSLVGLDDRHADRRPHELSGGQCQRVALARAIALEPSLVVLDEPTAALDVSVRAQVCNLLLELQDRLDCAFVLVSHDLGVVRHLADRIVVMRDGRLVESGAAGRLCTEPDAAYTERLLAAATGRIDDPTDDPPPQLLR
ncbi:dipeptide ABC transporter ATP-binding protein [Natronolimnohabitans innermongolicus]|uniref:Oligopeptide/dipeptide ABC transporter, ATPase subunit n=1 Tax=Natronolimnohabitans innermongolicus JCM 12255 TaxID=1227499 RepID=L9X4S9_9EURY|nr:ABC transporter ATP-binding protein [Natronolimnohabitans innermongolicus]ELY56617.1 oligopeptide/dipeptide ABC transporter, ATPase subunit [Natronolimnohabitans innermongolicus JCM 12255]